MDKELYFGIDAAGNKHVHVNGTCYTNDELGHALEAAEIDVKDLREKCDEEWVS